MVKAFVILTAFLIPATLFATECRKDSKLIITAPRQGAHTFNNTISLRGFSCRTAHIILVKNETTNESFLADTDELCDGSDCVYRFATFVHNLAIGVNNLKAIIPGQDSSDAVPIQIIRTALVWNEEGLATPRNFFQPSLVLPYNGYRDR